MPSTPLPSAEDAAAALRGEPGATGKVVRDVAVRGAIIGLGLALAGERENLVVKSLAASAVVELFVLGWEAVTGGDEKAKKEHTR
ncbi:MAG TPA: hypothetical protein VF420_13395 [Casimicrobiaceae bacterium]